MNQTCQFISYDSQGSDNELTSVTRLIFSIYRQFYVYFVLAFGPINIIANLLSMFILTRKELRGSYSSLFLCMTLDHTIVVSLLVATVLKSTFTSNCDPNNNSLARAIFTIVSQNGMDILRAHASWLAVLIASLRFWAIRRRGSFIPSLRSIISWCLLSLLTLVAASTPVFLSTSIQWIPLSQLCRRRNIADDKLVATVRESHWTYYNDCMLLRATYIISGTLYNGIPCLLLFALSILLLRQLRQKSR
ncbi:hypothetical protein PMAYCL1PPCAC_28693 [Pristionchus mayeri]|uniref:G protein-coupled receptor n=1 Tax=Pristionchus mayeri TaxID=1317129 RepID=A0AAN5IA89_9BILA|nr:hypothetical protein PMAYCL1PPCAC_28693 [Pristionchus mayeri]